MRWMMVGDRGYHDQALELTKLTEGALIELASPVLMPPVGMIQLTPRRAGRARSGASSGTAARTTHIRLFRLCRQHPAGLRVVLYVAVQLYPENPFPRYLLY
jgi:hypothetical protein